MTEAEKGRRLSQLRQREVWTDDELDELISGLEFLVGFFRETEDRFVGPVFHRDLEVFTRMREARKSGR